VVIINQEDCEYAYKCKNAGKRCLVCNDYKQFRPKKSYSSLKSKPKSNGKGLDFEEVVFDKYKSQVLGRTPGSGAFSIKGDIQLIDSMLECKSTKIKKGGKKQITLKKETHDKIEKEAENENMTPFVVYGFKESDGRIDRKNIYFSTKYNYLLNVLSEIKVLREKLDSKNKQIEKLKERLKGGD